MVTITEQGILIKMQGEHYDAETLFNLTNELSDVLRGAIAHEMDCGGVASENYWHVFELLKALTPTFDQLRDLHPKI